ncbi:MAG: N-acetylgalactosamine-6-sulfatase, partial [Verrucomicrobia bacterium]|nr:N-acetylgalactosamine-6-sulfatase [Verrucomicrobiota bacterium]
ELYDLSSDLGEDQNVAGQHPNIVARAVKYMEKGHQPDPKWKIPAPKKKKRK